MYVDLLNIHVMLVEVATCDDRRSSSRHAGMEKLTKSDQLRLAIAR